jgi:hypothetical protein
MLSVAPTPPSPSKDIKADDKKKMDDFKSSFSARLRTSAAKRRSDKTTPRTFRRLDSLARLLEGDSICAAVSYDAKTQALLVASNQIHRNSRADNKQVKFINKVIYLIRDENLSLEEITRKLIGIIITNFLKEERRLISVEGISEAKLTEHVGKMLRNLFLSGQNTRDWLSNSNAEDYEGLSDRLFNKLAKKVSRLARDFLKLRSSLLTNSIHNQAAETDILNILHQAEVKILKQEGKGVHAEMGVIAVTRAAPVDARPYTGISKLSCDHCGLAMDVFSMPHRGQHGQGAQWPFPSFISTDAKVLEKYQGKDTYAKYQKLSKEKQKEALSYMASKDSSPIRENARHGRKMEADSSESDVEAGLNCSDEAKAEEITGFSLEDVWSLRYLKYRFSEEFRRLTELGIGFAEVLALYKNSTDKFLAIANEKTCRLIWNEHEYGQQNICELLEKLSVLYDADEQSFWGLVNDEEDAISKFGFDEVYDRIFADSSSAEPQDDLNEYRSADEEELDRYQTVAADLEEENGWDYDYCSNDSENEWGYKDSDSEAQVLDHHNNSNEDVVREESEEDEVTALQLQYATLSIGEQAESEKQITTDSPAPVATAVALALATLSDSPVNVGVRRAAVTNQLREQNVLPALRI